MFSKRAGASRAPEVAVITMVRDEARMLPRWVRHYGAEVGHDNLIVLDDNSRDGSTDDLPCTVHRVPELPGGKQFEPARMRLVNGIAQGLLAAYDVVVFTDADEFLVPDPDRHSGLVSFLQARPDREVIAPVALNVVHHLEVEGPLRDDQPVVGQRRFGKYVPIMCKPSMKRVPADWRHSSHGIMAPFEPDPELFLLHLKFADHDLMVETTRKRQEMIRVDGRAANSNWKTEIAEMTRLMHTWVEGQDREVSEFDPASVNLGKAVARKANGLYKTTRPGQLGAMSNRPLVRLPERLVGRV